MSNVAKYLENVFKLLTGYHNLGHTIIYRYSTAQHNSSQNPTIGSLQKVQGHTAAQAQSWWLGSSHPRGQQEEMCQPFAFNRLTIAVQIYNKYTIHDNN